MKNSGFRRIKLIGVLLSASGLPGCLGAGGGGGGAPFGGAGSEFGSCACGRHWSELLASGYLTYSLSADALLAAFMLLHVGEQYVPAEIFDQEEQPGLNHDGWLTGRERDVLNGLLSGKSNKEIAIAYGLSEVTIKHHLKNLRSKLGARNRTHAVCRAIELGLADDYSVSA